MELGLAGRAVLVTGANRGLGRDLALAFAREGADVGICARDAGKLRQVQQAVQALGVRCVALTADLDEDGECERVVDTVAGSLGRLDILVNNASTNIDGLGVIRTNTVDELMRRVTGKATWAIKCSQAAVPHLVASGTGRVIFIGGTASRASYRAGSAQPANGVVSAMGNAMIVAFAKYLQEEVIADQVLVNVIHPGAMRTDRFLGRAQRLADSAGITFAEAEQRMQEAAPLKRLVTPEDVTPLVLLLASPLASAISAQAIAVDGGATPSIVY
jgi:3-oxoacyl-[acyl-carrier protein] reductase